MFPAPVLVFANQDLVAIVLVVIAVEMKGCTGLKSDLTLSEKL